MSRLVLVLVLCSLPERVVSACAHQVADARVNAKGKESGSLVRGMDTMGVSYK